MATLRATDDDRTVSRNFKRLRALSSYSLEQVGEVLNVTSQQVEKYEKGINRISAGKLKPLKELFNCEYADFYREEK